MERQLTLEVGECFHPRSLGINVCALYDTRECLRGSDIDGAT